MEVHHHSHPDSYRANERNGLITSGSACGGMMLLHAVFCWHYKLEQ
jgi:hypothetical protein